MIKKILFAAMLAGSLGSVAVPAASAIVIVREAPPEPRSERVMPPRKNKVWVPGHWDWRGNRHVWVRGKYINTRRGYYYVEPKWEERDGRWQLERGTWRRGQRDRDGDGVPNRMDDRPNNPNRY